MDDGEIRDAKRAMMMARRELDQYVTASVPDPLKFDALYQAVLSSTERYFRQVRGHMDRKYGDGLSQEHSQGDAA